MNVDGILLPLLGDGICMREELYVDADATCGVVMHDHSLYLHAILQLQQQLCGVSIAGLLTLED